MLIIEGSDGVGKTTLCHKLVTKLQDHGPWIYSHFTKLPDKWRYPMSYRARMSRFIVQDRFHMSEIVYREARQESQFLTPWRYSVVDAWLRLLGGFTVVIVGTENLIRKTFHNNPQMFDIDVALKANRLFTSIVAHGDWPGFSVDVDFVCPVRTDCFVTDKQINEIIERYIQRQDELWMMHQHQLPGEGL